MNQKIKSVFAVLLVFLATILLSIFSMRYGGYIHSTLFDTTCTGSIFIAMNFDKGCQLEGFIYFYFFWLAILAFTLLKQKMAWLVYVFGTMMFWGGELYFILNENLKYVAKEFIGSLVIMVFMSVVGWLLAQGGSLVYKKLKK